MSRSRFVVTYDICDDKRLRQVFKKLRGAGDHLQLSVFRCDLSARELAILVADLEDLIDHRVDQVLIIDIGPSDGRALDAVQALGSPYVEAEQRAIIV
jgi:CRISPR-associated protein Cas2